MTNTLAFILAVAITALILTDQLFFSGDGTLFAARRLAGLFEWLAFWR